MGFGEGVITADSRWSCLHQPVKIVLPDDYWNLPLRLGQTDAFVWQPGMSPERLFQRPSLTANFGAFAVPNMVFSLLVTQVTFLNGSCCHRRFKRCLLPALCPYDVGEISRSVLAKVSLFICLEVSVRALLHLSGDFEQKLRPDKRSGPDKQNDSCECPTVPETIRRIEKSNCNCCRHFKLCENGKLVLILRCQGLTG